MLDEIDKKLLSLLSENSRITCKELGKHIGFTSMGIKKRILKLLKNNVLKFSIALNANYLKLYPAFIFLEIKDSEKMEKIINQYKDCPRILNIFRVYGSYNLIALIIAEDENTLSSIAIEECSLRSREGVRRSEFIPINEVFFEPYLLIRLNLARKSLEKPPCGVDCNNCKSFKINKCVGCPAIINYHGPL
ncbi:MAG: AsnC family transcriptional regulator [Nitrososphaerota archaeon]